MSTTATASPVLFVEPPSAAWRWPAEPSIGAPSVSPMKPAPNGCFLPNRSHRLLPGIHRRTSHKPRRRGLGGELPSREIRQLEYLPHLGEIDFFHGIGGVVIVGMKPGKPPEGRN